MISCLVDGVVARLGDWVVIDFVDVHASLKFQWKLAEMLSAEPFQRLMFVHVSGLLYVSEPRRI